MASLRKKYSTHIDAGPRQDEPPVSAPPEIKAAELPPAVETKPVEPMVESSPAEEAGKNRLREELRKMENAEVLQRQQQPLQQPQQPQQPQEPIDPVEFVLANSGLPERAKAWLRKYPEYVLDPEKNAELQFTISKLERKQRIFLTATTVRLSATLAFQTDILSGTTAMFLTRTMPHRLRVLQRQCAPRLSTGLRRECLRQ